ncbi:MAG TPA: hypothetical protein VK941_10880, partial [Gillisia sp.]|nr:hypothetical protein [Gillisia sp.]
YDSLLEKENFTLKPDFEECHRIKYGRFLAGFDTIIRYSSSKMDMEKIISPEGSNIYTIKWLDSCT